MAVCGNEDVFRFQVEVDDAPAVELAYAHSLFLNAKKSDMRIGIRGS
jgi:hypothetical protein